MSGPDDDRTIIRPQPGGLPQAPARHAAEVPAAVPPPAEGIEDLGLGAGPLMAAASPLLALLARLRGTVRAPAGGDLRSRAVTEIRAFEREAAANGIEPALRARALALLCAALDDSVLATPWGSTGAWAARPMLATFAIAEDRFFETLREAGRAPAENEELLELGHLCLALGYAGRFRASPRAGAMLDRVRADLHAILATRRHAPVRLAPRAHGAPVPLPAPGRVRLPVWVAAVGACALLGSAALAVALDDEARSDRLASAMLAAPPDRMPTIGRAARVAAVPTPGLPTSADRLRATLRGAGLDARVLVGGTAAAPISVIADDEVFANGATLSASGTSLLQQLGRALAPTVRTLDVVGYVGAGASRSTAFRSAFALSAARARAASHVLAAAMGRNAHVRAEGRGAADTPASIAGSRIELVSEPG